MSRTAPPQSPRACGAACSNERPAREAQSRLPTWPRSGARPAARALLPRGADPARAPGRARRLLRGDPARDPAGGRAGPVVGHRPVLPGLGRGRRPARQPGHRGGRAVRLARSDLRRPGHQLADGGRRRVGAAGLDGVRPRQRVLPPPDHRRGPAQPLGVRGRLDARRRHLPGVQRGDAPRRHRAVVGARAAHRLCWPWSGSGASCSPWCSDTGCWPSAPWPPTARGWSTELVDVEERERQALAEHLHDGALQYVLAARQDLEDVGTDPVAAERVDHALGEAIQMLRSTLTQLHPVVVQEVGLLPALRDLTQDVAVADGSTYGWSPTAGRTCRRRSTSSCSAPPASC